MTIALKAVDPSVYEFAKLWVEASVESGEIFDDDASTINDLANQLQGLAEAVCEEHQQ